MKPTLRGVLWIGVYLAVVLTPLALLLVVPAPPGGGFWWDLAIGLGFAALVMMCVQFLLTARFRRATAPFGIDIIYYFHRYVAYVLLAVLLAHPLLLIGLNPALVGYLNPFGAPIGMTAGNASVLLVLILVAASVWRRSLGIAYEPWRTTHLGLAVGAVALAFLHMESVSYYTAAPLVRALWMGVGSSLVGVVLWVRVLRPISLLRTPYRVTEVRKDLGDSWSLTLEPEGHRGFDFAPGQFAWLTLRASPLAMREHPFSISSAPTPGGKLEFTIKELGDFTRTIGTVEPGERAYVDGPYGSFTVDRHPGAPGFVFIAGGIGIAPIVSMLRALADRNDPRPHILIAAHSHWDRIPLGRAIAELERRLRLKVVHVLESPPEGWGGEVGWITREILERHLPEERDAMAYFVCGPVPMIEAVQGFLDEVDIPARRVHSELFDLV